MGLLLGLVAVATRENFDAVDDIVGKETAEAAAIYHDISTLEDPTKSELQQDIKDYLA